MPVQALRFLRIVEAVLRLPCFVTGRALGRSLRRILPQIGVLLLLVLIFWVGLAAFGLGAFQRSLSRRCVYTSREVPACATADFGPWSQGCNPQKWRESQTVDLQPALVLRGAFPFEIGCKVYGGTRAVETFQNTTARADVGHELGMRLSMRHDMQRRTAGSGVADTQEVDTCRGSEARMGLAATQACRSLEAREGDDFVHFDHMGGAFLAVVVCSLLPETSPLLNLLLEAEPAAWPAVYVFFLLVSMLCTYFILGLFVVVISGSFVTAMTEPTLLDSEAERRRHRRRRRALRKRIAHLADLSNRNSNQERAVRDKAGGGGVAREEADVEQGRAPAATGRAAAVVVARTPSVVDSSGSSDTISIADSTQVRADVARSHSHTYTHTHTHPASGAACPPVRFRSGVGSRLCACRVAILLRCGLIRLVGHEYGLIR